MGSIDKLNQLTTCELVTRRAQAWRHARQEDNEESWSSPRQRANYRGLSLCEAIDAAECRSETGRQ